MDSWKQQLNRVIFGTDTPAGRAFDIVLLWVILVSVLAVVFESVGSIRIKFGVGLKTIEWGVTALFTIEYVLRLLCAPKRLGYARSFFGIVDLLAVLPTYVGLFLVGHHSFIVIRTLRLLRIFRVLKLARFMKQADYLLAALRESRYKIGVFIGTVLTFVLILGTVMYLIEGEANGFSSIPQSMYWAIVTMTTVGYGDIAPMTVLGKMIASVIMLIGYSIIAVPTGIVTFEVASAVKQYSGKRCEQCGVSGHQEDARYCRKCGASINS